MRFYLESQLENLKRFTEYHFILYEFPIRELLEIFCKISTWESQEIHKIPYFSIWVFYKRTLWDHTEGPLMSTLTLFSIDASIRSPWDLIEASQLRFLPEISLEKLTWDVQRVCVFQKALTSLSDIRVSTPAGTKYLFSTNNKSFLLRIHW